MILLKHFLKSKHSDSLLVRGAIKKTNAQWIFENDHFLTCFQSFYWIHSYFEGLNKVESLQLTLTSHEGPHIASF